MEQSSVKLWSLLRSPQGPLVPYLDAYASSLNIRGFKRKSIAAQVRLVANFSRWLKANHIELGCVTGEHAQRFLRRSDRLQSIGCGSFAALLGFMALLHQLGVIGDVPPSCATVTPIEMVVNAFGQDLRQAQGLSQATYRQYIPFIEDFLAERFGSGYVDLAKLCAADVVEFITHQATRLSQARAKSATIALRSFLRHLRYRGEIALDLAAAVPTVPNWSMTGIPRAMDPDHVRAVLASCKRDTAVGCRDYAILMLLSRQVLSASYAGVVQRKWLKNLPTNQKWSIQSTQNTELQLHANCAVRLALRERSPTEWRDFSSLFSSRLLKWDAYKCSLTLLL